MAFPDTYEDCTPLDVVSSINDIIDYDRITNIVQATGQDICDCSTASEGRIGDQLDTVESGIRQVIANVVEEVNENQSIIELGNGEKFKIMI